jgi:DNA-binding response OmpR family regulator
MSHRILVVDDDPAVLGSLRAFLHDQLGFDVETALLGKAAVEAALAAPFDLCILDVNLPDLTGSEVYLRLRSIHPAIEAVFYTGVSDFENSQDFLRFALPPERVLAKPANFRQLTQVIMGALGPPRD